MFLDNAVTSTLVFEGGGQVNQYVGGYNDWLVQRSEVKRVEEKASVRQKSVTEPTVKPKGKLSYRDQRELAMLPQKIESQEAEMAEIQQVLSDPGLYRNEPQSVSELSRRMTELERQLSDGYARWEALENQLT